MVHYGYKKSGKWDGDTDDLQQTGELPGQHNNQSRNQLAIYISIYIDIYTYIYKTQTHINKELRPNRKKGDLNEHPKKKQNTKKKKNARQPKKLMMAPTFRDPPKHKSSIQRHRRNCL